MPYTTGSAADMAAVKTALVNACTADGWTHQTDAAGKTVLSKSGIFVQVEAFANIGDGNPGFTLLGRTSLDGGDAPNVVSMRTIGSQAIVFPVTYHIFTFTAEVYCIINFSDIYQFVAFGQSSQSGFTGTGNWVAASCAFDFPDREGGIGINSFGGSYAMGLTSAAFFWDDDPGPSYEEYHRNYYLHSDIDALEWEIREDGTKGREQPSGARTLSELINTQPNDFNGESVLMPIRLYKSRPEDKVSQIAEIEKARYIRIDNYKNEQVITLGTDEWMLFPFYRKDINSRGGGFAVDHTGTFGWAIKKEN